MELPESWEFFLEFFAGDFRDCCLAVVIQIVVLVILSRRGSGKAQIVKILVLAVSRGSSRKTKMADWKSTPRGIGFQPVIRDKSRIHLQTDNVASN